MTNHARAERLGCIVCIGDADVGRPKALSRRLFCASRDMQCPDAVRIPAGCQALTRPACQPELGIWGGCQLECPCKEQGDAARFVAYADWWATYVARMWQEEAQDAPVKALRLAAEHEDAKPPCPRCGEPRQGRSKLCEACAMAVRSEALAVARWGRRAVA